MVRTIIIAVNSLTQVKSLYRLLMLTKKSGKYLGKLSATLIKTSMKMGTKGAAILTKCKGDLNKYRKI